MKEPKKITDLLSEKDYQKIKEHDNLFHKAIMLFICNTGLRQSELLRLNFSDVYLSVDWIIKPVLRVANSKNDFIASMLYREIPLNDTAKECIEAFHVEAEKQLKKKHTLESPLIVSKKTLRFTIDQLNTVFRNLKKESGVDKLTPLMLRHYFAFSLKKQGIDLKGLQKIMGYRSIITTAAKYGDDSISTLTNAVNKI